MKNPKSTNVRDPSVAPTAIPAFAPVDNVELEVVIPALVGATAVGDDEIELETEDLIPEGTAEVVAVGIGSPNLFAMV
jgi:hypothetical protein